MKEAKTRNFGVIHFEEGEIISFPRGLIGLADLKRFSILAYEHYQPLKFLQSLDNGDFSFIIVNPYLLDPTYSISLDETDQEDIELPENGGLIVYIILTLPADPTKISVNFLAPVVINSANMKAKQLILTGSNYSVAQPVVLDVAGLKLDQKNV